MRYYLTTWDTDPRRSIDLRLHPTYELSYLLQWATLGYPRLLWATRDRSGLLIIKSCRFPWVCLYFWRPFYDEDGILRQRLGCFRSYVEAELFCMFFAHHPNNYYGVPYRYMIYHERTAHWTSFGA